MSGIQVRSVLCVPRFSNVENMDQRMCITFCANGVRRSITIGILTYIGCALNRKMFISGTNFSEYICSKTDENFEKVTFLRMTMYIGWLMSFCLNVSHEGYDSESRSKIDAFDYLTGWSSR